MSDDSDELEEFLGDRDSWRREAFEQIKRIPAGHLANYGRIAELVNENGHSVIARNIGWFRNKLYELLGHETAVPLHRVAKLGDIDSLFDSPETKVFNDRERRREGFFDDQKWV